MSTFPEVLAPAGSADAARAAVRGGADAVYLGYGAFNARRSAKNFTLDELRETVAFCHENRVAVHAALNTLVFPDEAEAALLTAREAADAGVDAFIVQDLGLAALLRQNLPDVPLHASTQLSVHNAAGARFLRDLGFARVVLAREMSCDEIAFVHDVLPDLELEVFVHGALCMSVSGQCLLSAVMGGRSGNRGMCAQPCRLPFAGGGKSHALSLRDLSLTPHVAKLAKAGVASLKIEGRMKRPEYVAVASLAVRNAVDGFPSDPTVDRLLADVFSRSGFTDGYFTGQRNAAMFGTRTDEDAAATAAALGEINALTRGVAPRLPVALTLKAKPGVPVTLTAVDGRTGIEVTVEGDVPSPARMMPDPARTKEKEALSRLGGTPYRLSGLTVDADGTLFLPQSALNDLRRAVLRKLTDAANAVKPPRAPAGGLDDSSEETKPAALPRVILRAEAPSRLPALAGEYAAAMLWFPLESIERESDAVKALCEAGHVVAAELARFLPAGREADAVKRLKQAAPLGVTHAVCGNAGHIPVAMEAGLVPVGSIGLNVTNPVADGVLRRAGVALTTLSPETPHRSIHAFSTAETAALCYGRIPVMLMRACPLTGEQGCASCKGTPGEGGSLTDRRGERFPVVCRRGFSELLNSRPVWTADRTADRSADRPIRLFYFTVETAEEAADVLTRYDAGEACRGPFTRGIVDVFK